MTNFPSNTMIFLFTDIEGSTSRWEHHPAAMQVALVRHDTILREVLTAHGGIVFKTVGDAFYCVFSSATDALDAALDAQRALVSEAWGIVGPLQVRMVLHIGTAEQRDNDYFGPALNRTARLLAAGHGGQILLSLALQELVRDQLPPGSRLHDLGEHRLKDLIRPERIFQLESPDLPANFPPLRTLRSAVTNLPIQTTALIGREQELAQALALLHQPDVRLVTLTGPGGIGKTRLGLQLAAEASTMFEHGVFFVALSSVNDPDLVVSAVAQAIGFKETSSPSLLTELTQHVRDKQMLIMLDNFEQVADAAKVVTTILSAAPHVKVLVTSRAVLKLYGEQEFAVPPLALPDIARRIPLALLVQYPAVALFIARARATRPDFSVTEEHMLSIAEICIRLDGLPLAIELAAARVKMLTPSAILSRLTSCLTLLTGGPRDLPPRQQTLRDTIDWSYHLLRPLEQQLFAMMAIFVGGCTLQAAEEICALDEGQLMDTFTGLALLCDNNLLRQADGEDGQTRLSMIGVIREYALERLQAHGQVERLRQRHAKYYLMFAEEAEAELTGPQQTLWLNRLDVEHDNLRAALRWLLERDEHELAIRFSSALWRFWYTHGHLKEGRYWLETILGRAPSTQSVARANGLNGVGILAWMQTDYVAARSFLEQGLSLRKTLGDERGVAASLNNLGLVAMDQGDTVSAQHLYEASLHLWIELQDQWGTALALSNLGNIARACTQYAEALRLNEQSLAIWRAVGDHWSTAATLGNLACLHQLQGAKADATRLYEESLALRLELGDREGIAECLEGFAWVAGVSGQPIRAAKLCAIATMLRTVIGAPLPETDRLRYEQTRDAAHRQLNDSALSAMEAELALLSPDQLVAFALMTLKE